MALVAVSSPAILASLQSCPALSLYFLLRLERWFSFFACYYWSLCYLKAVPKFRHQLFFMLNYHSKFFLYKNIPTTPITAMGCRQYLPLSVVQLQGKHCQKAHCHNGVADTFWQGWVKLTIWHSWQVTCDTREFYFSPLMASPLIGEILSLLLVLVSSAQCIIAFV